jgi:hypothetical protein
MIKISIVIYKYLNIISHSPIVTAAILVSIVVVPTTIMGAIVIVAAAIMGAIVVVATAIMGAIIIVVRSSTFHNTFIPTAS